MMFNQDYLDGSGAQYLARKIRQYWAKRDLYPTIRIVETFISSSPQDAERPIYVVRSDMVCGWPKPQEH